MSRVCDFFFQSCATFVPSLLTTMFLSFLVLSQLLLTMVHISSTMVVGSVVNLRTMVSLSDWRESLHFISLFQFGCFTFSVSFQAVSTKSMYSGPIISCVNRVERWNVQYMSQKCIHAMLDSNSICSEGSAHQCIFIII